MIKLPIYTITVLISCLLLSLFKKIGNNDKPCMTTDHSINIRQFYITSSFQPRRECGTNYVSEHSTE